jgi:hypothetical protein
MGMKICGVHSEIDPFIKIERVMSDNSEKIVENRQMAKSKAQISQDGAVTLISRNWFLYKKFIHKSIFEKSIIFDSKIKMIGKFITEEEFNGMLNQTILLLDKNRLFLPFDNHTSKLSARNEFILKGPIQLINGDCYKGQWNIEFKRHGVGILICSDGSKYEGFWENDVIQGKGRFLYTS